MNEQNVNKNQYIAVFVAIVVVGGMFFGVGLLYRVFVPDKGQAVSTEEEIKSITSLDLTSEAQLKSVEVGEGENEKDINKITYIKNMEVKIIVDGVGEGAKVGDTVAVHYTGKLTDGTVFDSSIPRGQAFEFRLGEGRVIAGWEEGVKGMKIGEKRTLTIPGDMAYGSRGVPNGQGGYLIPPNATLVFDVELLNIK